MINNLQRAVVWLVSPRGLITVVLILLIALYMAYWQGYYDGQAAMVAPKPTRVDLTVTCGPEFDSVMHVWRIQCEGGDPK